MNYKEINKEIILDTVRIRVDNLEVPDNESIINTVCSSTFSQIKDPDEAEDIIEHILWEEYNIER
jgi:hypothetical protein